MTIKNFFIFFVLLLGISFSSLSLDIQVWEEKKFERVQPVPGYDCAASGIIMFDMYNDNPDDSNNYFEIDTAIKDPSCDGWLARPQLTNNCQERFDWQDPRCYFRWNNPWTGWEIIGGMRIYLKCFIYWNSSEAKGPMLRCKLGRKPNGEGIYINVRKPDIEPQKQLKVEVKENMNLGKTFAGGTLSTRRGGTGTPAEITIKSEEGNNFKLHIPKMVTIRNSHDQTLDVNLGFRNATTDGRYSPSDHRDGYAYTHFRIDGVCRTKPHEYGKYEGSFTVRVEYTDEN